MTLDIGVVDTIVNLTVMIKNVFKSLSWLVNIVFVAEIVPVKDQEKLERICAAMIHESAP